MAQWSDITYPTGAGVTGINVQNRNADGSAWQNGVNHFPIHTTGNNMGNPYQAANLVTYAGQWIPTLWAEKMITRFYASTMLSQVSNTWYEALIQNKGDSIIINTEPDVDVVTYEENQEIVLQRPKPNSQTVSVDQALMFAVQTGDVLTKQSQFPIMSMFTMQGTRQMGIKCESEVFYEWYANTLLLGTHSGNEAGAISGNVNLGGDGATISASDATNNRLLRHAPIDSSIPNNVYNAILDLRKVLDEANVPQEGRFILMTPDLRRKLMSSDLARANWMGDSSSIVRRGSLGMIDGFSILVSNLLPIGAAGQSWRPAQMAKKPGSATQTLADTWGSTAVSNAAHRQVMIAGINNACTFMGQLTKLEAYRSHAVFGDNLRSLKVYGRKVIDKESIAKAIFTL